MKLCLLLILLLPVGIAAQESPKPTPQTQNAGQQKAEQSTKWEKQAKERDRLRQAALETARQEVASQPDSVQAHFHLAEAMRDAPLADNDLPKVADEYRKTIQLKPDYAEAYFGLATVYRQMNQHDKVFECLNKAIQLKPDYAEAYLNLGEAYIDDDRYVDGRKIPVTKEDATHAVEAIKKALAIKPDYEEGYLLLGMAYAHLDKGNEAVEAFKQALLFNPDDMMACSFLSSVYIALGNKEAALQTYNKFKEIGDSVNKQMKEAGFDDMSGANKLFADQLLKKIQERFGDN